MRLFLSGLVPGLLTLGVLFALPLQAQAQIIFQLAPDPPIQPLVILSSVDEYTPESNVTNSLDPSLETPAIATKDQEFEVNLLLLSFYKRRIAFTYRQGASLAEFLSEDSDDALQLRKQDLPSRVFHEAGAVSLPIPIGGDFLLIYGGASITTDKKDINNEDYNSSVLLYYILNPKEQTSYRFGVLQRSFLGVISPIFPLAEVAFNGPDYQVALGAIHVPELPSVAVVPFVRLTLASQLDLAFEIIFPIKVSLFTTFFENWSLQLTAQRHDEFYRLTQKAPWESAILNATYVRSTLEVGYHLFGAFLLKAGIGNLSDRKYVLLDKEFEKITDYSLASQPFPTSTLSLALQVQFD